MTEPTGSVRTGRVVGLSLLAVSAAAAVIGVITLVDGGEDAPAAQQPPPSATVPIPSPPSGDLTSVPRPTTVPSATTAPTVPPSATTPPATTTQVVPPTTAPPTPVPPKPTGDFPHTHPLRVYNNSTIAGLAARAGQELATKGWPVAEVGNYSGGKIPTTTVYFEPGTDQEPAARELATQFGLRVESRFDGIKDASPGLIVIVTNDYKGFQGKQ